MSSKLRDDDRRAIDLLLDSNVRYSKTVTQNRLKNVESILHLLDNMPAIEPPADLVLRTLSRIDGTMSMPSMADTQPQVFSGQSDA